MADGESNPLPTRRDLETRLEFQRQQVFVAMGLVEVCQRLADADEPQGCIYFTLREAYRILNSVAGQLEKAAMLDPQPD